MEEGSSHGISRSSSSASVNRAGDSSNAEMTRSASMGSFSSSAHSSRSLSVLMNSPDPKYNKSSGGSHKDGHHRAHSADGLTNLPVDDEEDDDIDGYSGDEQLVKVSES
jgi:hypothetical protein